jgi:Bacterial regulatory protein, arsR family.
LAAASRPRRDRGGIRRQRGAISQHLKVLREARLVRVRVEAQRRIYSLDPAGLGEIDAWLRSVRQFWSGRLDALERELRRPQATTKRKRSKR